MTRPAVLITGVGRPEGIGAGIAERLAADCWDVAFGYWAPYDARVHGAASDRTADVVQRLEGLGGRVFRRSADLSHPGAASALISDARDALGPLSALVLSHTESVDSGIRHHAREFGPALRGECARKLVSPGPINTGWMTDEIRESALARQPTGRLGTPADTADLVAFLLSAQGGWINGQLLKSDGGFSA